MAVQKVILFYQGQFFDSGTVIFGRLVKITLAQAAYLHNNENARIELGLPARHALLRREVRNENTPVLFYRDPNTPGRSPYFDMFHLAFADENCAREAVESGRAVVTVQPHPYIVYHNTTDRSYFDVVQERPITCDETANLRRNWSGRRSFLVIDMELPDAAEAGVEVQAEGEARANWGRFFAAGGVASLLSGTAAVPWILGFTTAGVAGGSIAAGVQAGYIGSVVAGSWFATLQSIGATTVLGTAAPLAVAAAVTGGTLYAGYRYFTADNNNEERNNNDRDGRRRR